MTNPGEVKQTPVMRSVSVAETANGSRTMMARTKYRQDAAIVRPFPICVNSNPLSSLSIRSVPPVIGHDLRPGENGVHAGNLSEDIFLSPLFAVDECDDPINDEPCLTRPFDCSDR